MVKLLLKNENGIYNYNGISPWGSSSITIGGNGGGFFSITTLRAADSPIFMIYQ